MIKSAYKDIDDTPTLSAKDTKAQKKAWNDKANKKRAKILANGGKIDEN